MKTQSVYLTALAGSVVALFATTSWAVPTVCVNVGIGAPAIKLAIASNFFEPAQAMAQHFIDASGGSVSAVLVCHNSTGHLNQEILNGVELPNELLPDPGFPRYDYFFAANTSTPQGLQVATGNTAFLYAKGIPVLYSDTDLNPAVTTVGDLITGLGTGARATIPGTSLTALQINSHALQVGIANPPTAPYGQAAKNITTAMGYAWAGNTPPSPPVHPSLFGNIEVTHDAVGTTVAGTFVGAAFVAKSQICSVISKPVQFVEFTGFVLEQAAIQLSGTASSESFDAHLHQRLNTDWDNFLDDNCYGGVRTAASVPVGPLVVPLTGALILLLGARELGRRRSKLSPPSSASAAR